MSELSGHNCPRCDVELYIEMSEQAKGVDLLICKECWGVGVAAKSMQNVISKGEILDRNKDNLSKRTGTCKCPICSTKMDIIELDLPENIENKLKMVETKIGISSIVASTKKVVIDSCSNCPTFWFDAGELDLLNGIQPKMRDLYYDSKSNRLIEDQTLTEEELSRKSTVRKTIGSLLILFSLFVGAGLGFVGKGLMALLFIGGLIAVLSKNPNDKLAIGTCDKCLEENKYLAWNCQRGGCWAHICSDCQTIGDDPVEIYAKTLGKVAVGTVAVGLGVALLFATEGSIGGGGIEAASWVVGSEKEENMILCRECMGVTKEDEEHKENEFLKPVEKKKETLEEIGISMKAKAKALELSRNSPCEYVDPLNSKKCSRLKFRHLNYCYMHK